MARSQTIPGVRYLNAGFPALQIETFTLGALARRISPAHLLYPRRPEFHHLILCTAGEGAHYVDFERYDCRAGTVLHARPGQVLQFAIGRGLDAQLVLFTPTFLLPNRIRAEQSAGMVEPVPPAVKLDVRAEDQLGVRRGFEAIVTEYRATDGAALSAQILQHLLHALLLRLARASNRATPQVISEATDRIYRRFLAQLERRFAQTRRVEDYARDTGCSAKTLGRACIAACGKPPKELIDSRVSLEAKRLLAHTRLPVGVIAVETGFSEVTNFVKFFRRCEGVLPSRFREKYPGLAETN